ncbi:SGNH/GDSL hydrolase family protein [Chryseobacterium sp. CCH4-E10]|uniref:SGNH/GDSL hydrolase family protein n=1 Tax=Chryseobacterium sp. CCH4-E10 TaxID=1768758 RepID=UPI000831F8B2|nr:SGNH/GDSL hydrolase family protein [Chryseobacterium sp. CCH4-E10]
MITSAQGNFKTTEIIKIDSNASIALSGLPGIHNALGYIWYGADKATKVGNSYIGSDLTSAVIYAPANAYYLQITVNSGKTDEVYNGDTIQIEINSSATSYEPYIPLITQINDLGISIEKVKTDPLQGESPVNITYFNENVVKKSELTFESAGKNLFNPDNVSLGYIDINTGARMSASTYVRTNPIAITPNAIYVSGLSNNHNALGWRINDASDNVIAKGYPAGTATEFLIDASQFPNAKTVDITLKTSRNGDSYNPGSIQIEYGAAKTNYEPYKKVITAISGYNLKSITTTTTSVKTKGKHGFLFGDSITATAGESGTPITNWPSFAFPIMQATYTNFALSGAHIEDFTTSSPRQKFSVQIDQAIATGLQPDFIVVSIGVNSLNVADNDYAVTMNKVLADLDITKVMDAMRINLRRLAENFPNAVLYYGTPMQAMKSEQLTMRKIVNQFKLMAQTFNFKIIDAFEEAGVIRDFEILDGPGRYLTDGLHPNLAGKEKQGKYYANSIINQYP